MSYDVYFTRPACKTTLQNIPDGPTYNLTGIFDLALTGEELPNPETTELEPVIFGKETDRPRGLRLLNGKSGRETATQLLAACERLESPDWVDRFRALEPPNRWGSLDDARSVMRKYCAAAVEFPENVWRIQ